MENSEENLENAMKMGESIKHIDGHVIDKIFSDKNVTVGRCHTDIVNIAPQPFSKKNIHVWFEGELYNTNIFQSDHSYSTPEFILEQYNQKQLNNILPKLDGVFVAVIYDQKFKRITIVNDRYGLQYMYWSQNNKYFAWCSESKGLANLSWYNPKINRSALASFLKYGYLTKNQSWLEDINLLPPASILTFDINTNNCTIDSHWNWSKIKQPTSKFKIHDAINEWGFLFKSAVTERTQSVNTGITLSGGLDSRAILAALPEKLISFPTVTFGKKGCEDHTIAKRVAQIKKSNHAQFFLNKTNWLAPRLNGVWWTDGEMNIMDLHGIEFFSDIASHFKINLNGFGGDGVHGGSFLNKTKEQFEKISDPYGDRGRRCTAQGIRLNYIFQHVRMPFYSNALMELAYTIPREWRRNSKFYAAALLYHFPEFFKSVPWASTGIALGTNKPLASTIKFYQKISNRIRRDLNKFGVKTSNNMSFFDYDNWIRASANRVFFDNLFKNRNAIYPEYLDPNTVLKNWNLQLKGLNQADLIGRYATIEIYFQQLFNKNYLTLEA